METPHHVDPAASPGQPSPAASLKSGRRWSRERLGKWCLYGGVALFTAFGFLPAPYTISSPGPSFNAAGVAEIYVDGEKREQDVIEINGATEHESDAGTIYVMTVNVAGNPQSQPRWFEILGAWADPTRDVKPVEVYYPEGVTVEQRDEYSHQMMIAAQDTAIAAALTKLGYEVTAKVVVHEVKPGSAADGKLLPGDRLLSVDGTAIDDMDNPTKFGLEPRPTEVIVERDGKELTLEITPKVETFEDGPERAVFGVALQYSLEFPIDVNIELGDVGGPSAGTSFALSIYELLTPGDLTNGKNVAATGTITPTGEIGPIGGVRQKYHAAVEIGADYILVPEANCAEAIGGGAPNEIPAYAVQDFDEALRAVEAAGRGDTEGIRTCQQAVDDGIPQA